MKKVVLAVAVASSLFLTGCASYRTSSNINNTEQSFSGPVVIIEGSLPGKNYTEISPIEVSIKKLTVFHKDPTKELVNEALIAKARSIGANAVINVEYSSGVGLTTWGYMDAEGVGVKTKN